MDDAKLALKHAVERYSNAKAEHESAKRQHDEALTRTNAAHAKLRETEQQLMTVSRASAVAGPRYIRVGSHRVIIITPQGVESGQLETE